MHQSFQMEMLSMLVTMMTTMTMKMMTTMKMTMMTMVATVMTTMIEEFLCWLIAFPCQVERNDLGWI